MKSLDELFASNIQTVVDEAVHATLIILTQVEERSAYLNMSHQKTGIDLAHIPDEEDALFLGANTIRSGNSENDALSLGSVVIVVLHQTLVRDNQMYKMAYWAQLEEHILREGLGSWSEAIRHLSATGLKIGGYKFSTSNVSAKDIARMEEWLTKTAE
ncbi:MAG: hypothetical protein WC227_01715 [Patescibacteria group bacterium]|jgi:hypothetical protein